MIEEKDYLMRLIHALIRMMAMLRNPFNRLRELERHDLFRQCFDITGVDITHIGTKPAREVADRVENPRMMFYFSELLEMYRTHTDASLDELQQEVARRLKEQGVINIKEYL